MCDTEGQRLLWDDGKGEDARCDRRTEKGTVQHNTYNTMSQFLTLINFYLGY